MKFEYDLHEFLDNYKEDKIPDIKDIALDSRNAVLLPGRFYVLPSKHGNEAEVKDYLFLQSGIQ